MRHYLTSHTSTFKVQPFLASPAAVEATEQLQAALRLNSELVVDGATQPLLASDVSLGHLNRNVPEQELNLVQFSAGKMT
jgi:glutamate dehydrogenase/leucine dehydrogenase